jgi:hypothetical protein
MPTYQIVPDRSQARIEPEILMLRAGPDDAIRRLRSPANRRS